MKTAEMLIAVLLSSLFSQFVSAASPLLKSTEIAVSSLEACVVANGGVFCWGYLGAVAHTNFKSPRNLVAGSNHFCAITDGGVKCFGRNDDNQLDAPAWLTRPQKLTAGGNATCAKQGDFWICWGRDESEKLKIPTKYKPPEELALGLWHACGISEGKVFCWGDNFYRQLEVPDGIKNPKQIVAGEHFTCVLDDEGVKCWGLDNYKFEAEKLTNVNRISAYSGTLCAGTATGLFCRGEYHSAISPDDPIYGYNQIGNPTFFAAASFYGCAGTGKGIKCWSKQRGNSVAFKIPSGLDNPRWLSADGARTCALVDDGLKCWGHPSTDPPRDIRNPSHLTLAKGYGNGGVGDCALENGTMRCWSDDSTLLPTPLELKNPYLVISNRQLGSWVATDTGLLNWDDHGNLIQRELWSPRELVTSKSSYCGIDRDDPNKIRCRSWDVATIPPKNLQNPRKLTAGGSFYCVVDDEGVKCWQQGNYAQPTYSLKADLKNPTELAAGSGHICALTDDGVVCWLKDQLSKDKYGTTDVPKNLKNPRHLAAGSTHTCAATDDGVRCWGLDAFGRCNAPNFKLTED